MTGPVPRVPPVEGARLVVPRAQVEATWDRLASSLEPRAADGNLVLLGVLLGGAVPLVQISQRLTGDVLLDVCRVSRYGDETRGGQFQWIAPPRLPLSGRDVVIVDDIFDEGFTLAFVAERCRELGARSITTLVFVRKSHGRPVAPIRPDLVGLELGDEFLFGCGMDYRGRWRHLPDLFGIPGA